MKKEVAIDEGAGKTASAPGRASLRKSSERAPSLGRLSTKVPTQTEKVGPSRGTRIIRGLQALLALTLVIAAPVAVVSVFTLPTEGSLQAFWDADGQIKLSSSGEALSVPDGEQGNIVNASKFNIPFEMGSKYDADIPILYPDTRPVRFKIDKTGGNPMGVGELGEEDSGYLDYRRTAYNFDADKLGGASSKRPRLHFEHTSAVVETNAYDACEYYGPPPSFVAGKVPTIKNAFGVPFTPMVFAPSKFYAVDPKSKKAIEVNEVCVAYVTECPLTPTTDSRVAKYCQETNCFSDRSLPGYTVLPTNKSLTVSAPTTKVSITATDRRNGEAFYHSSLKIPYAKLTDPLNPHTGCLMSTRTGESGNCLVPGVSLVSYHTHHAFDTMPLFMQITNPENPNLVKAGPAEVSFNPDYFTEQLGYRIDPSKVQNCQKITSDPVRPAYVQNVAPWGLYGEEIGGDALGPNGPKRPPGATYEKLVSELNRFSAEEFDVMFDYRPGSFPLDPATTSMKRRQYNNHLEKIFLCVLQPDFDKDCYANLEAANPGSTVVVNFRYVTAVICLLYPALFIIQKTTFPEQHDRFGSHTGTLRMALKLHVWAGIWIIFSGTTFVICNWASPLLFRNYHANEGAWEVIFIITGIAGVLHALASYRMLEAVQGDRRLTIPMYFTAISLNLANSILLLRDYNKHDFEVEFLQANFLSEVSFGLNRFLLLWASITTFIYVRAHIVLMVFFKIHYYTCYTYSIIGAAAIVYPLSGQSPWVYIGLALFVFYAPAHTAIMRCLGWRGYDQRNEAQATSPIWTDQVLIDLMRYQLAASEGDAVEMERIENEEYFGDILEAQQELSTRSIRSAFTSPSAKDLLKKMPQRSKKSLLGSTGSLPVSAEHGGPEHIGTLGHFGGHSLDAVRESVERESVEHSVSDIEAESAPATAKPRPGPNRSLTKVQMLGDIFTGVGDKNYNDGASSSSGGSDHWMMSKLSLWSKSGRSALGV